MVIKMPETLENMIALIPKETRDIVYVGQAIAKETGCVMMLKCNPTAKTCDLETTCPDERGINTAFLNKDLKNLTYKEANVAFKVMVGLNAYFTQFPLFQKQ